MLGAHFFFSNRCPGCFHLSAIPNGASRSIAVWILCGHFVFISLRWNGWAMWLNFKFSRESRAWATPGPAHTCILRGVGDDPLHCAPRASPWDWNPSHLGNKQRQVAVWPQLLSNLCAGPSRAPACTCPNSGQGGRRELETSDPPRCALDPGARLTNRTGNRHAPASTLGLHTEAAWGSKHKAGKEHPLSCRSLPGQPAPTTDLLPPGSGAGSPGQGAGRAVASDLQVPPVLLR